MQKIKMWKYGIKWAVYVSIALGFCGMFLISSSYFLFPFALIGLGVDVGSSKYHALVDHAVVLLLIAAFLLPIDCFRLVSIAALRGLKDTKFPMYISITGFWLIAFPLAYLLGFHCHFGGSGIWWALVIGVSIAAIISFVRFHLVFGRVDLSSLVTRSDK